MNVRKFLGKLVECGMNIESISEKMGLNPSTVYRKIRSTGLNFSIGEMHKIVSILGLSKEEAVSIFLPMYSHKCENEPAQN